MWIKKDNDTFMGGHAMTVVGYTEDSFIIRNSWGDLWGDKGYCYYNFSDWGAHWELWCVVDDKTYVNPPGPEPEKEPEPEPEKESEPEPEKEPEPEPEKESEPEPEKESEPEPETEPEPEPEPKPRPEPRDENLLHQICLNMTILLCLPCLVCYFFRYRNWNL